MHDINKELEKFFQLLEEAESSSEKDDGASTNVAPASADEDRNEKTPLPNYSVSGKQETPASSESPVSRPVMPTPNKPVMPTPNKPVLPTPIEHLVNGPNKVATRASVSSTPNPAARLPEQKATAPEGSRPAETSRASIPSRITQTPVESANGSSPPAARDVSPPARLSRDRPVPDHKAAPSRRNISSDDKDAQASRIAPKLPDYPSSARPDTLADSQSSLDQLMQEVRGKLNQPARPKASTFGSPAAADRHGATIVVDAPVPATATTTPTWRKGVLTGLAMVLPACLALAIVLNRPSELSPDEVNIGSPLVEQATGLPGEQAELSMNSNPQGARIFLDGELFGVTPFESIRIKPGTYQVTAEVPGFASLDTTLTLRARHWVTLNIGEDNGEDVFYAGNDGAQDHILAGIPSSGDESSSSDASDNVQEELQAPQAQVETPRQRKPSTEEVQRPVSRPRPTTGSIAFTSEPSGAQVFLDNKLQGVTPFNMSSVAGGSHAVRYSLDGYEDYTVGLELTPGTQTPLHGSLSPAFGTIVLDVENTGSVFIDGSLVETDVSGSRSYDLPAGVHTIAVQRSGAVPWEMTVTVNPGQAESIQVEAPNSEFDNILAEAEQLYGRGEYPAAKEAFQRAQAVQPGNRLVIGKISEIDRLISAERTQELTEAIIENGVYLITDTPPKLVGGLEELHKRVKYPEAAYQAGVTGRVYIQFVVNEDGTASDFTVTKGLPLGCNEEAIRAIRNARFEPAKFEGRTVKARHTLFVNFDQ